jgi:hypothetical protein
MNKWGVFGFIFGVLCIVVVAGVLFLASREVAPPASPVVQPAKEDVDMEAADAPARPTLPTATPAATPTAGDANITMTREATPYAPGQPVDVTVTLAKDGPGDVRAMGLTETIPEGWTFEGLVSDTRPDINRPVGSLVEFAWFKIPTFPISFTYRLIAQGTTGPQPIEGEALWRTDGEEMRTGLIRTAVEPGTPRAADLTPAAPAAAAAPPAAPAMPVPPVVPPRGIDVGEPLNIEVVVEETEDIPPPPAPQPNPDLLNVPVVVEEDTAPETPAEPAADAPAAAAADAAGQEMGGITLTREVVGNAYTPGQPVTVQLTLTHTGEERVTALAITEDLPENWAFAHIAGGQAPTVSPPERATGTLNFIWVNVPQFPFTVSYLIDTTEQPGGPASLKGKAIYRKLGPELQTDEIVTELSPVAQEASAEEAPVAVVVEETAE